MNLKPVIKSLFETLVWNTAFVIEFTRHKPSMDMWDTFSNAGKKEYAEDAKKLADKLLEGYKLIERS